MCVWSESSAYTESYKEKDNTYMLNELIRNKHFQNNLITNQWFKASLTTVKISSTLFFNILGVK